MSKNYFFNIAASYHCRQEIDSTLDRLKKVERDLTLKEKQLKERESKLKEREKHLEQQFKVVVGEYRTAFLPSLVEQILSFGII